MKLTKSWLCRLTFAFSILTIISPFFVFAKSATVVRMPAGADFCLTNLADYNQYKSQLPQFLQTTPVWLGADKKVAVFWHVVAALKISFRGNAMVIISDIWNPKEKVRYTDMIEIKQACFFKRKKSMVVESVNGVFSQSGYTNSQLTVQGVGLSPVSAVAHQSLIDKVGATNGNRPGRPTPTVGVGK